MTKWNYGASSRSPMGKLPVGMSLRPSAWPRLAMILSACFFLVLLSTDSGGWVRSSFMVVWVVLVE